MKVYYAHPITLYDTPVERADLGELAVVFTEIVNPNGKRFAEGYKAHGMEYFREIVADCDVLAFRPFADGTIPAGIAKEIRYARENGLVVLEMPGRLTARTLDVNETREKLKEMRR